MVTRRTHASECAWCHSKPGRLSPVDAALLWYREVGLRITIAPGVEIIPVLKGE